MIDVLSLSGLALGFIFFLLFLFQNFSVASNRLLSLYVLLLTVGISEPYLWKLAQVNRYPLIMELVGGLYFIVGPVLWFYTKTQLNQRVNGFGLMKHGILFFAYIILVATINISDGLYREWTEVIVYEILYVHIFLYFFFSLLVMAKEKKLRLKESVARIKISWAQALIISSIVLFGCSFAVGNLAVFIPHIQIVGFFPVIQVLLFLMILLIALLNTDTMSLRRFTS